MIRCTWCTRLAGAIVYPPPDHAALWLCLPCARVYADASEDDLAAADENGPVATHSLPARPGWTTPDEYTASGYTPTVRLYVDTYAVRDGRSDLAIAGRRWIATEADAVRWFHQYGSGQMLTCAGRIIAVRGEAVLGGYSWGAGVTR